jgi:crotonobetainyl-CoA:carnitine CoA-transferase CaiB-like acyl-CoA transferase
MIQDRPDSPPTALGHLSVLEVVDDVGEFCGKMLADMGADVVRVEPPEGAETRRIGPFLEDHPHPERSLHFWHYNTNKRSVTLNLDEPDDQALFKRLAGRADILVESMPPSYMDERELSYNDLRQINPRLIYVSISAFGRGGPRGGIEGGDLAGWASSGYMFTTGWKWHPPTRPWARQAAQACCLYAVSAALSAVLSRWRTDRG